LATPEQTPSPPIVTDFATHFVDDRRIKPGENRQQRQMSSWCLQDFASISLGPARSAPGLYRNKGKPS
jgi:hypothetical protein